MQIGAENRTKTKVAIGLGAFALLMVLYQLFSSSSSTPPSTQAASAPVRPVTKQSGKPGKKNAEPRLDPTLQLNLLAATEQMKYTGTGRNIFVAQAEEPPAPIASPVIDPQPKDIGPPPPPPPPPINLKFFGFASKPGEPKKVFLAQGEDVFIAQEGDIVNRRYKILHIGTTSIEVEDVLYNNRQSIPLTQGSG